MGVERGGRASKIGDTYERLWAVRYGLFVLNGHFQSVQWEPIGDDEVGVDILVTSCAGSKIGIQLKRQNRSKEYWSPADLKYEQVLQNAKFQLGRDPTYRYHFVSSCGVRGLADLAERATRHHGSAEEFLSLHVQSEDERLKAFNVLLGAWGFDPENASDIETAIRWLGRIEFEQVARTSRTRSDVEVLASSMVEGDPSNIVAAIGDHFDNNLGRAFHADDIRQFLTLRGFRIRQLTGDPSLPAAVDRLQSKFDRAVNRCLIADSSIERPESKQAIDHLSSETPPKIILVHGSAGAGKSVVIHQVYRGLRDSGIPVLPFRLHIDRPEGRPFDFGRRCDLPASPATSIRALAGSRRAVLLFDQVDALRFTSSHSPAVWESFTEIIDECLSADDVSVVIVCRSFDSENDPYISNWRRELEKRNELQAIRVGEFPEDVVNEIVGRFGVDFSDYSTRQQVLLKHPNNLAIWAALAESGHPLGSISNSTQLMEKFLNVRQEEVVREHGVSSSSIKVVLDDLVAFLDRNGRLDAPVAVFSSHSLTIDALCSVDLLSRHDSTLSFVHQSYFDFLLAQKVFIDALNGGGDPIEWVMQNQSLFRRDQLRQLMLLLRDQDKQIYGALLGNILEASDIRFHLKHLVLGILQQVDAVMDCEVNVINRLANNAYWRDHVMDTIWGKLPWFTALDEKGEISNWLSESRDELQFRYVLRFLRSVIEEAGDRVDELLSPYWDTEGDQRDWMLDILSFNPCDDSPRAAQFRLELIEDGVAVFGDLYLDQLAEQHPGRLVDLIATSISRWLIEIREQVKSDNDDKELRWPLHERLADEVVLDAIRSLAELSYDRFSNLLVVVSRLSNAIERRRGFPYSLRSKLTDAQHLLDRLVTASIEGMVQQNPTRIVGFLTTIQDRRKEIPERTLANGILAGGLELADRIVTWLCRDSQRFRLGETGDSNRWAPALNLIERFSPHCSQEIYAMLESKILAYHDPREERSVEYQRGLIKNGDDHNYRNDWGLAQHVLLSAIPLSRLSEKARNAAATWIGKFGDPAKSKIERSHSVGGIVRSPIPNDRVGCVSDREWLRIFERDWSNRGRQRWRQIGPEVVSEASVRHFSESLFEATKQDPLRFAELALQIPPDSNPEYVVAILRGLCDRAGDRSEDSSEEISELVVEEIIEHIGDCDDSEYVRVVCRAIETFPEGKWGDSTIDRLIGWVDHAEPQSGEFTVSRSQGSSKEMVPDVIATGYNCVRGSVALAITGVIWKRPENLSKLIPSIEKLITDSHPSVRSEAMSVCLPFWNHDQAVAVDLMNKACDHADDRVLGSRWINRLLQYACTCRPDEVESIISRMAMSPDEKIAHSGAFWAAAGWLDQGDFTDIAAKCRGGSVASKTGVIEAAMQYLSYGKDWADCTAVLKAGFRDEDPEVRSYAARVFRRTDILDKSVTSVLAQHFVDSPAFMENPTDLFWALKDYAGDLTKYATAILRGGELLAQKLSRSTRDMRERNAFAGNELSTLLFRLYESTSSGSDSALAEQCLDCWDIMLQERVGLTERHLRLLDE